MNNTIMEISSNYLDVHRFKKDYLAICEESSEAALDTVINKIDEVGKSISTFLRAVDDFEGEDVQSCCRIAAIAQKYNAKLDYRSGYPYIDSAYNNDYILAIQYCHNTAVVNKYGECLIGEDQIYLNPRAYYNGGYPVRKAFKGMVLEEYGFLSHSGSLIVPCIFDDCDMHIGESNLLFNNVNFRLYVFGALQDIKVKDLSWRTDMIYCVYDSVVFALRQSDLLPGDHLYVKLPSSKKKEATEEVRELLADRIVPVEELQKMLERQ